MTDQPVRASSKATKAISTTTIVAARALKKTGEHRATELAFAVLGVGLLAFDAYFLFQHPPAGVGDQLFHGGWAMIAIGLIPGAASRAAGGIKQVGSAAASAWKSKDGGA